MTSYVEKVDILKIKADDLKKNIPFSVKFHPKVKAGEKLQDEGFRLMHEMAQKLDEGAQHGEK